MSYRASLVFRDPEYPGSSRRSADASQRQGICCFLVHGRPYLGNALPESVIEMGRRIYPYHHKTDDRDRDPNLHPDLCHGHDRTHRDMTNRHGTMNGRKADRRKRSLLRVAHLVTHASLYLHLPREDHRASLSSLENPFRVATADGERDDAL